MSKILFLIFLKGIIKKTVNTFSIISLFVLIITFFLEIPIALKSTIQGIALIAAFLFSSYNFWKDSYKVSNQKDELVFNLSESKMINSIWQRGLPTEPSIYFDFDIQNRSTQKLILKRVDRLDKTVSDNFIINKNSNTLNLISSNRTNRMENIFLPFDLPERDHKILRFQYSCKFKDYTIETLISFLSQNFLYDFDFNFQYSDIDNQDTTIKVNFKISYSDFKEYFIEFLRQQNRTDILNSINI